MVVEEKCIDCGKPLDAAQGWIVCGRCHPCHFKSNVMIPEYVRILIKQTAIDIDAHAKVGHGLDPGEECRQCLIAGWTAFCEARERTAFCEAREIMGMGNTWTQNQRVAQIVHESHRPGVDR